MTQSQYFNKFIKILIDSNNRDKTQEELFNEIEKWHFKQTGKNKYSNYETFRVMKSTWYRNSR